MHKPTAARRKAPVVVCLFQFIDTMVNVNMTSVCQVSVPPLNSSHESGSVLDARMAAIAADVFLEEGSKPR